MLALTRIEIFPVVALCALAAVRNVDRKLAFVSLIEVVKEVVTLSTILRPYASAAVELPVSVKLKDSS